MREEPEGEGARKELKGEGGRKQPKDGRQAVGGSKKGLGLGLRRKQRGGGCLGSADSLTWVSRLG